jgi:hypothetical protein|tara:strand:- start:964 stop:1353 length:390 start_codon:yes stop_codon:yes gene_type:complete
MNSNKTHLEYEYIEDANDKELECIKIIEGKYNGFVYQYGQVSINEEDDESQASLNFNYRIIEDVDDSDADELQTILGDILVDILENHVEETEKFTLESDKIESNEVLGEQIKSSIKEISEMRNDDKSDD